MPARHPGPTPAARPHRRAAPVSGPAQPPPDSPLEYGAAPAGYAYRWGPAAGWRVATPAEHDGRYCRRPGCRRAPVAALFREGARRRGWWLYCDWHLYGRRVRGGVVVGRRLEAEA